MIFLQDDRPISHELCAPIMDRARILPPNGEQDISGILRGNNMRSNSGLSSCQPGMIEGYAGINCDVPQRGNHSGTRNLAGLYDAAGRLYVSPVHGKGVL